MSTKLKESPAKPLTSKQILKKVSDFCERMHEANNPPGEHPDWDESMKKMDAIMEEIQEFDLGLGEGLMVGRLVRWPQGDGHACYFVTAIKGPICHLEHLEWMDNWHSPVVQRGKALREAVEQATHWTDGMRKLFGKKKGTINAEKERIHSPGIAAA